MRSGTRSQCKFTSSGVTWSNLRASAVSRAAAAFSTGWSRSMSPAAIQPWRRYSCRSWTWRTTQLTSTVPRVAASIINKNFRQKPRTSGQGQTRRGLVCHGYRYGSGFCGQAHWRRQWLSPFNRPLKPQSNGPSYSNTVIGRRAVDGWVVTFGTVRRGPGASLLY